jgi:hypothetical protein
VACRIIQKVCKTAAEAKLWGFDYVRDPETGALGFLARAWRPGQVYPADVTVLPNRTFAGLQFVSSGGQSGRREPTWPTSAGGTVTDGSITWTAETLSNDALQSTITLSDWEADTGLTIASEELVNTDGVQRTSVIVGGGAVGRKYEVRNIITLASGAIEESVLLVEIS